MVAALADFVEIDLTGLEIGPIKWAGDRLQASFGAGYGASAVVGPASGLWGWEIASDCLPDDAAYQNLISGKPRFEYYTDFIKDHITGTTDIFIIDFRGKKYHASFVENSIAGQMLSYDLFNLSGIQIKMRKVPDIYYYDDGSIFDPANLSAVWGWYGTADQLVLDESTRGHDLVLHGNVNGATGTIQNGFPSWRFNGGATNTGYLNTTLDPIIYEAFFAIKINEATFSNYGGVLSADTATVAMVGLSGGTKLDNLSFGGTYSYRLNGDLLTEATQNTPMNVFGVIHGRWASGITLANLQIGKDRDFVGRFLEADIGEIVLCDALLSTADSAGMDAYLMRKFDI